MTKEIIQIAIDGPAGAGKSSVAKILSNKLGIVYLNTGAMYRAFAYHAIKNNFDSDLSDEEVCELFENFDLVYEKENIILNGKDISSQIRTPEIDKRVSGFASNPLIRKKCVQLQQKLAQNCSIVMEGRDICKVVLPNANYKFYLDASVDERANRRYSQNLANGINEDLEDIKTDIQRRDKIDSERKADPLCIAEDAIVIDSTNLNQDEVADYIIGLVNGNEK